MDNENEMNEIQKRQAIARMNQFKNTTMTVQELYDKLSEFIKNGDGDAMIDVSDNDGGSYVMSKTMNMICYKCKKHIINEKTAVGCIVEDYGIGGIYHQLIDGMPATNAYLCFDCYKKEMEQHKKDMKEMEEREKNGEIFF